MLSLSHDKPAERSVPREGSRGARAKETILSLLPVENGEVAFKVVEPFKVLGEYREFRAKSGKIFSLSGSIALMGSGIGIFNYMIVEVLNRRKEIGVLRAVGVPKWLRLFGIALGLSGALGALSGLGPALVVASNQDPVECLRME